MDDGKITVFTLYRRLIITTTAERAQHVTDDDVSEEALGVCPCDSVTTENRQDVCESVTTRRKPVGTARVCTKSRDDPRRT